MKEYIKNNKFKIACISILILGVVLITVVRPMLSFDFWWHTKAGEYMVQNKSIPFTDVFSWYGIENNLSWYSHEWLSEVVIYLFTLLGKYGGYIFTLFMCLSLFVFLFISNIKNFINNITFSFIWLIVGGAIFISVTTARPHMISFLLLAISLYVILSYRNNENNKFIWSIPVISFLWANFHGGSSNLPYILCLIVLLTSLFNFSFGKIKLNKLSSKQIKTFIIVIILSIMAIIINPHGADMILYPYSNMNDSFMLSIISEWRCPDLKLLIDLPIFIEIGLLLFIFIATDERIDLTDLLLVCGFVYLTLKSIRFAPLLYIVATYTIFKYIKAIKYNSLEKIISKISIVVGGMCVFFYILNIPTIINSPYKINVSNEIIETIKAENPQRLYNEYGLGGYLIYNDIKVFVDGRADMYSKYNLKDVIALDMLEQNPEDIINKYNFDLFVIDKNVPLAIYLNSNSEYQKLIEDDNFVVFKPLN